MMIIIEMKIIVTNVLIENGEITLLVLTIILNILLILLGRLQKKRMRNYENS